MRVSDLKPHIGSVIILDLVNGAQLTTKLTDIEPGDELVDGKPSKHWAIIDRLLIFQVIAEAHNPREDPHPIENPIEHKVRNGFYGFPLFETEDGKAIDVDHIIMAYPCHADMEKVYIHQTTGIQIADAGALNALDAANPGGKIQL